MFALAKASTVSSEQLGSKANAQIAVAESRADLRQVPLFDLGEHFVHHSAFHIGQTEIAALKPERQTFVI